jgi:mannose-6-phosphate isomerase-like protein (cupin superfamily)
VTHPRRADDPVPGRLRRPPLPPGTLADIAVGLARSSEFWQPRLAAHPTLRSGLRLLATTDYDAWLLRWPVRSRVTPHDHGDSVAAFTVVKGELLEVRWHRTLQRTHLVGPGDVVTVDSGVVHDVIARGPDASVSVHVYSPPLTAMGYYDEAGGDLLDRKAVDPGDGVIASTRSLHPSAGG